LKGFTEERGFKWGGGGGGKKSMARGPKGQSPEPDSVTK